MKRPLFATLSAVTATLALPGFADAAGDKPEKAPGTESGKPAVESPEAPTPRSDYYRERTPKAALVSDGKSPWVLFRPYRSELTDRIDAAYAPGTGLWIDSAWALMLMKQGIVPESHHGSVSTDMLELWEEHPTGKFYGHKGLQGYVTKKHGIEMAGTLMVARTNPPQHQQMEVRKMLLKVLCLMHEFQEVLLENGDKYKRTVMPGYTHIRHAQPTTFGHYLMSVYDPVARSVKTLEDAYHGMNLNELGCGALAGTSWPIDRELVSRYLGLEGLLENTNDAVAYSDGYVLATAGAANVMTVLSRLALELEFWSTAEYDFLDFGVGAGSFMMPNKRSNQGTLEEILTGTSKVLGSLMEVSSMGARIPHGDMQPLAYRMDDGVLEALEEVDRCVEPLLYKFATIEVKKDNMLARAREGYSCSTELANDLCRHFDLDYRTAHDLVNHFVVESAQRGIPSREASLEIFQEAARAMLNRELDMKESQLRELLDPVHFVEVTTSRGGVSPREVARMIAERRKTLAQARARNLERIEVIEAGRELLLSDLRELHAKTAPPEAARPEEKSPYAGLTISEALAQLAVTLPAEEIPDTACRAAKKAVLDALGCAMAGHQAPGVPMVVEQAKTFGGKPEAGIWFHGGAIPSPEAAFVNSVQVHALDLDDVHLPSVTHIGSVVVPAAFSMGEATGASGKDTLAAVILGIEVAGRIGRAHAARRRHEGFLPTSIIGGFGATAAAARLKGLSPEKTADAMGIWYAHCSGNRQALLDGTLTKRIQPGIAARAGLFAACLAERGITGPDRIIGKQPAALLTIYGADPAQNEVPMSEIMEPRETFEVEEISYKRFACCGASHPLLEATLAIVRDNQLKIEDVAGVEIFGIRGGLVGTAWRDHENPHVLAQFCAPYELASVIKNRRFGPAEITAERIAKDKDVDALARSVRFADWKDWDGEKPEGRPQGVRVRLRDGKTYQATGVRDDALRPDLMPWDKIVEKFKENARFSGWLTEEQTNEFVADIDRLDEFADVREFIRKYLLPK